MTVFGTTTDTDANPSAEKAERPSVFIVDDEPGILEVVSNGLTKAGYRVTPFSSGQEFERAVLREAPDICIIDLSLPDRDGVAILNELGQQDYRGSIVLISGHSQQLLRSVSRLAEDNKLQIIGCVRKPFTMKPLLDTLRAHPLHAFSPSREEVLGALRNEEIVVRYQPIVDLPNHHVMAAEALVRWQHPSEGLLHPARFLHKLDSAGMSELTSWVLRHAFQSRVAWMKQGYDINLAVNIPVFTLGEPKFVSELQKIADRYELPLNGLTLEISENEMITDTHGLTVSLSALCMRGVRLSVDDFGTGFSSLSRLQRLPIDEVKIDKSFIHNCAIYPEDRKIVEAIIALSHALDMKVVAEGVDTEAAAGLLYELGCDYAQGYLFGRAMAPDELTVLLAR